VPAEPEKDSASEESPTHFAILYGLSVKDMKRAREFYEGVLGLKAARHSTISGLNITLGQLLCYTPSWRRAQNPARMAGGRIAFMSLM